MNEYKLVHRLSCRLLWWGLCVETLTHFYFWVSELVCMCACVVKHDMNTI